MGTVGICVCGRGGGALSAMSGCLYCLQLFEKFQGRSGHACQAEAAQIPPKIPGEPEYGLGLGAACEGHIYVCSRPQL